MKLLIQKLWQLLKCHLFSIHHPVIQKDSITGECETCGDDICYCGWC